MPPARDTPAEVLRRRLEALRQKLDEAEARDDERFALLVHEVGLAEHRLVEQMVDDRASYPDAFELVLADWEAYLDKLKRKVEAARPSNRAAR